MRLKTHLMIFLSLMSLVFDGGRAAAATGKSPVVARVDNVDISIYELNREVHRILPLNSSFHGGVSPDKLKEVHLEALDNLLDQAYKVLWAKEHQLTVSRAQLDKRLQAVHEKFPTQEALQKALGTETLEAFESAIERTLLAKKAEQVAVTEKVSFSEAETKDFYQKNAFMYQLPKRYRVSHVLVKVDPSLVGKERDKLFEKARELTERAKSGEDFYNLAYYNSDEDTKFVGGDIGYFNTGQTVKEFEDAIRGLEPGDIVGPVETLTGFHVIKLTDVQEPRLMSYDEVKDKIRQTVEKNRRESLYSEWLAGLKSRYKQEILHPKLKKS